MKEDKDFMSNEGDGQEMVPIEEEGSSNVSCHHCKNFQIKERAFNHIDPNDEEKEISKYQGATQHTIEDERTVDQGEFYSSFIPTWCLYALDNDFLCGEDLPIHPSMINKGDELIDNINTLDDGDKSTNEPLQISTFLVEMDTFTFDGIDELVI